MRQPGSFIRRVRERARRDDGLTFIEMVVTIVILGMITAATAAAFGVSIKASNSANDRIKKTNDAQAIATFLQRDAASAGGYDERNALIVAATTPPSADHAAPGVDTDGNKGFCDQEGSRVRFEWLERDGGTTRRVVANYGVVGDTLTRRYCTQPQSETRRSDGFWDVTPNGPFTETSATLAKHITNASAQCSPECTPANRQPVTVSLAITSTAGVTPAYTYSLSAFVRTGGASAQTNSESVPLITLGIPQGSSPCPATPNATAAGSSIAVSGTDGGNVMVDGIAAINARGTTTCGPPVSLPGFYNGASRLNATQTLIQQGTACNNCGPTIVSGAIPDPYDGVVAPPSYNANQCNSGNNPGRSVNGDRYIYSPGVYPRTLVLAEYGPARYEFNPGVYIFCRGIDVFAGTVVTNAPNTSGGVLFYFHGGSIRRIGDSPDGNYRNDFEYNDMQWILEGRPEYRNIVIWQPNPTRSGGNPSGLNSAANATGDLQLAAGDNQHDGSANEQQNAPFRSNFKGVIYAPNAQVEFFFPLELLSSTTRNYMRSHGQVPVPATVSGVVARNLAVGSASAVRIGPGPQTTTTLTANPNPSNVGEPVTLRAVVAPVAPATGTPTGAVAFYDNNELLGSATLSGGTAELVATTIGGGNRELQAIYSGDDTFGSSASPIINQTGNAAGSSTVVSTSANPSGEGQPLTIRATVAGGGPVATGNVQFTIDDNPAGTYPLVGGVASFVNTTLTQGTHTIVAQYLGSATYNPSSGSYVQEVLEGTVTVLTSTPNPSDPGETVTLTAVISSTGGSAVTGNVTFRDGNTVLGTAAVTAGQAQITTNALVTPGSHTLSATYDGNAALAGSSGTRAHTVDKANTTTVLVSNPNPSANNQNVTLTATVTSAVSGAGTPTGTVTFRDNGSLLGNATLNGAGVATLATDDIGAGSRTLTAVYAGDTTFNSSTGTRAHTVSGIATRTVLSRDGGTTVDLGEDIDLDADVYRQTTTSNRPTVGTVTFYDNGVSIGNGSRNNSTWSLNNVNFGIGAHEVVAVYNGGTGGGNTFAPSTSNTLTFTVSGYPTSIQLTRTAGSNPSAPGDAVTFRAQISESSPGSPSGEIIFRDGLLEIGRVNISGGQALFTTSDLELGDHAINAVYEGAGNFAGSTSNTVNHSVRRGTVVAVTSNPNPSNPGQSVTFTASVAAATGGGTPTGSVEFFDNGSSMGSTNLNGAGVASISRSNLSGGAHTITARYNPTGGTFAGSTSADYTHTVNRLATTVVWVTGGSGATGPNPSNRGQSVTLAVRVQQGGNSVTTGTVSFYDDGSLLGTDGSLSATGTASISTSFSTGGAHSITAVYNGSTNFEPSTSPVWTQNVNRSNTNVLLSKNPSGSSSQGQTVTFTADVDESATGTPTGTVEFYDNGVLVHSATVSGGGVATWSTNALTIGSHPIMARYLGDTNFAADDSSTLTHSVTPAPPTIADINPNSVSRPNRGSATRTIVIEGSGFVAGMNVSFSRDTNDCSSSGFNLGISNVSVSNVSGTSAQISFTLSSSATRCERRITVTTPNGSYTTTGSGSQTFDIT
jgi:prepilin-type N-terminal cleavage/methylation domain-containing protein